MLTTRIKLLKPHAGRKAGDVLHAHSSELAASKLEVGKDYIVLGTPPTQVPSDLASANQKQNAK